MNRLRAQAARVLHPHWPVFHLTRHWIIVLLIVVPLLSIGGSLAAINWPYRYRKIHALLEDMFSCRVKVGIYHRIYFPHPGFVATQLTLTSNDPGSNASLGTVETMFAESYWSDFFLFRQRVRLVEVTRMRLKLPKPGGGAGPQSTAGKQNPSPASGKPPAGQPASSAHSAGSKGSGSASNQPQNGSHPPQNGSEAQHFDGPETPIERLTMHDSTLFILRENGSRYSFGIRNLELLGLQRGHPWRYSVDLENALPAAHIAADGTIGPIQAKNLGATPLSGRFTVTQLKLSDVGVLHGKLGGSGHFKGVMSSIQAESNAKVPNFAVGTGQPTELDGLIRCTVNALTGDVYIANVEVYSGKTRIKAHGQVAGSPKITHLDIAMDKGRAEEVLRPFLHDQVPILGPATLHAHVDVGPPGKPFLQRMVLKGRFDAPAEIDTDKSQEKTLSSFSRRELKNAKNPPAPPPAPGEDVLSSIRGPATIRNGIISTSGLVFQLPGASADLHGTFNLNNEAVHLVGTLKMAAGLSHAATGWKSVVLKFLDPFFHRKDHQGSQIPIAVLGTPGHYKVAQQIVK